MGRRSRRRVRLARHRALDLTILKAAKALLEEAGWTDTDGDGIREDADGNKLTLMHGTTIREIRQDIQAVAQQMLREVGIDLQISELRLRPLLW